MSKIHIELSKADAIDLLHLIRYSSHRNALKLAAELDEKIAGLWDENHDQTAQCTCGHQYHRHFDSWEDNEPIGCKYCLCDTFTAPAV